MPARIVIIGSSPAGLTLARLLEPNSIPYIVFERDASFDLERRGAPDLSISFRSVEARRSLEAGKLAARRYAVPCWMLQSNSQRAFSTSDRHNAVYGFIGLGAMGFPMAANLRAKIAKEDKLVVHDVNSKAVEQFKSENGNGVSSAAASAEVAELSDVIITALPEPQHVSSAFDDILSSTLDKTPTGKERVFIDCSTIDVATSRATAARVKEAGAGEFVDAPMSGGVVGARAGSLTFMLGAREDFVPRVEPILMLMGKRVAHMGQQGNGLAAKLANNYALAIQQIAIAEAMNMGMRLGLEGKALGELISSSSGSSWSSKANNPVPGVSPGAPAEREYAGGFGIGLMRKDLRLAMTAAEEAQIPLLLAERVRDLYDEVQKADGRSGAGRDFSVVYDWLKKQ